jgi:hypothetical protein
MSSIILQAQGAAAPSPTAFVADTNSCTSFGPQQVTVALYRGSHSGWTYRTLRAASS